MSVAGEKKIGHLVADFNQRIKLNFQAYPHRLQGASIKQ